MRYFEIFGIVPPRLSLDPDQIEKKFYELSLEAHPDRNPEDWEAQKKSAEINQAYRTLKDSWSRAAYLLEANGFRLSDVTQIPTALAELYFDSQDASDSAAFEEIKTRILDEQKSRETALRAAFRDYDRASDADKKALLKPIQSLLVENKYAKSILADIESRGSSTL